MGVRLLLHPILYDLEGCPNGELGDDDQIPAL